MIKWLKKLFEKKVERPAMQVHLFTNESGIVNYLRGDPIACWKKEDRPDHVTVHIDVPVDEIVDIVAPSEAHPHLHYQIRRS